MRANLHLHSRYSDGTLWPEQIAARAAAAGLKAAALTDHDTMSGTAEFAAACEDLGLKAIPGVEIDCREPSLGYKSELLAYFPQGKHAWTSAFLEDLMTERRQSVRRAIESAAVHFENPRISFAALSARKFDGRSDGRESDFSFNKVDVFTFLRDLGAIPSDMGYRAFKRAYYDSRILSNGGREKALCSEVAAVVAKDGGFLVVPHIGHEFDDDPGILKKGKSRLEAYLAFFRSIGASGIELYQYRNGSTETINRMVRKATKPYGFFFTYGSDCHGPGSGKDTIGTFDGNFAGFPDS